MLEGGVTNVIPLCNFLSLVSSTSNLAAALLFMVVVLVLLCFVPAPGLIQS